MSNNKNTEKKEQKDTYEKLMGSGEAMLFSDSGFDEMQKAKNYEIGFKLFRAFYWTAFLMSAIFIMIAIAVDNTLFTITGFSFMAVCVVFYLIYAAKASAVGVMNPKLAKAMGKTSMLWSYIGLIAGYTIFLFTDSINRKYLVMGIMLFVMYLGACLFARRNMRVLEKQLKDEEKEQD